MKTPLPRPNPHPSIDELEKILVNVCGGVRDDDKYAQDRIIRAEAAIRQYALAEALKIIGQDEEISIQDLGLAQGIIRNDFRAELRQDFTRLWSSNG